MCVCACLPVCACMRVCVCVCAYVCFVCVLCACACVCARACVCVYVRVFVCVCVCVCVRVRVCVCACVQALQVCMPALVQVQACLCICSLWCSRYLGWYITGAHDPLWWSSHSMWCLQHPKGNMFVSYGRPRTNLSRVRSVGMSCIEANRIFQFWHAPYLKIFIALYSAISKRRSLDISIINVV